MSRDFTKDEQEFIEELNESGPPDELGAWLDDRGPAPSPEALNRIKRHTLSRLNGRRPTRLWQRLSVQVAAAVLLLAVISTLAVGPQRVLAGIGDLLHYIPGFGALEIEEPVFLAASRTVIVESGDKRLEVLGLYSNGEHAALHLRATGVWDMDPGSARSTADKSNQPYLIDEQGNKYFSQSHGAAGGSPETPVEASFRYEPLRATSPTSVTVVIPGHEELTAQVALVGREGLATLEEIGYMDTVQDITVTAVPEIRDSGLAVNLVFALDPEHRISAAGDYPREGTLPVLRDDEGRVYELLENNRSDLLFETVDPNGQLALTVPALKVAEPGEARVKLPLPGIGESVMLDEQVDLGRYPITITQVEARREGLRVYVDLGEPAERTLLMFGVEPKRSLWQQFESRGWGWSGSLDEDTGQLTYFQMPYEHLPQDDTVTLILKDPEVQVNGPWEFKFNASGITTIN